MDEQKPFCSFSGLPFSVFIIIAMGTSKDCIFSPSSFRKKSEVWQRGEQSNGQIKKPPREVYHSRRGSIASFFDNPTFSPITLEG
jgi:hypothetical protein